MILFKQQYDSITSLKYVCMQDKILKYYIYHSLKGLLTIFLKKYVLNKKTNEHKIHKAVLVVGKIK